MKPLNAVKKENQGKIHSIMKDIKKCWKHKPVSTNQTLFTDHFKDNDKS